MKFEDLLIMQKTEEKQKRMDLQEEVDQLKAELEGELKISKILKYALDGPIHSCPCLSSILPFKVQALLTELAMVDEEIMRLEKKVNELTLTLYHERRQTREWDLKQLKDLYTQHKHSLRRQQNRAKFIGYEFKDYDSKKRSQIFTQRRTSFVLDSDDVNAYSGCVLRSQNHKNFDKENPNKLSEELIKCLTGIFLKLNHPFSNGEGGSDIVPKQSISCMNSKSFISKTKPTFFFNNSNGSYIDPYAILVDLDGMTRDVGPYKNFTQITRSSLDLKSISECSQAIGKLGVLMEKLWTVNLNLLTYKQKLAFWINIYNACIMHAFLQHGLPSTQEKLLLLMNKAAINVGGIVLNALGIEHFLLRHPSDSAHGPIDEKEMLLRRAYGLGFPEPNVTFALCRGSWSSPALRVYTAEDIVDELARARLEYLEASVGVISKKKIVVPKLLQWHIKDFADDMESLLEWIYSQLPQTGSLKKLIMECLNGESKSTPAKVIEIQPYVYEFRYLLPS